MGPNGHHHLSRTSADLLELQKQAEAAGRRIVVGALIVDDQGRVFVHRRGPDRAFLPNCWDIPGGHLEPGETLLEALEREVHEETGWRVTGVPTLLYTGDWRPDPADASTTRREFDFLVHVTGDLDRPRLELPKHVEYRWVSAAETHVLDENRPPGDFTIRELVELCLRITSSAGLAHDRRADDSAAPARPTNPAASDWGGG